MKKISVLALACFCVLPALAQTAATASPHTLTGTATLVSDYRFRGISQTFGQPALQIGIDYSHASGLYLGNWNSNVSEWTGYPGGNLEMDFYGGWKKTWGDWGIDVGGLYYYYPGTTNRSLGAINAKYPNKTAHGGVTDNFEIYLAGSWKFLSLKYSHATTDYFGVPKTRGTGYWDLSANYEMGNGWYLIGHLGYTGLKDFRAPASGYNGKYADWKLGVTKDVNGWIFGAAYVGTDARGGGSCAAGTAQWYHYCKGSTSPTKGIDAGKDTIVVSVGKAF